MSAPHKFPDVNINGRNFGIALWFIVGQIYSFLFGRFQEFKVTPAKFLGPITLKNLWNTDVVAEIIQRHICRHLLFGITGIHLSKSPI